MKFPLARLTHPAACAAAALACLAFLPGTAGATSKHHAPTTPVHSHDGHHTPRPSIADMLARERTHTYNVDMNTVGRQRPQSLTSWRDECAATKIDDWGVGYIKDRVHFCTHTTKLFLYVPDNGTGSPGIVWFDWLVYGEGSNGSGSQRHLSFHSELTNVRSDPDAPWPANAPITFSVGCTVQVPASAPAGACYSTAAGGAVVKTLAGWQADPTANTWLDSAEHIGNDPSKPQTGEGQENVVMIGFTPTVSGMTPSLRAPHQTAATLTATPTNAVSMNAYARFDSAQYLSTHRGAIFRGVVPHISYDPSKPRAKELADHIAVACDPDTVNDTFPPGDGHKFITGCDIDHLLHRLTPAKGGNNKTRYNKNSNAKNRNCNANTPSTTTPGSKDCDEYPFASTYEGAAASEQPATEFAGGGKPNQFSIRRIDSTQNQNGGRDLNTFYNNDRVLDWATGGTTTTSADGKMRDGFWVRIGAT